MFHHDKEINQTKIIMVAIYYSTFLTDFIFLTKFIGRILKGQIKKFIFESAIKFVNLLPPN